MRRVGTQRTSRNMGSTVSGASSTSPSKAVHLLFNLFRPLPRVLAAVVMIAASAACASSDPWHWSNRSDPGRPFEGDRSRCALNAYRTGQQQQGVNAVVAQQLAFENCMAASGWVKIAGAAPSGPVPQPVSPAAAPAIERVVLVGGADRATFLGCLSCPAADPESVFNAVGSFGSAVSQTSIMNSVSPFGSPVSQFSACNPVASHPPVMIGTGQRVLGLLTLNAAAPGAISDERVLGWLRGVCSGG